QLHITEKLDEIEDEDCNGAFHNLGLLYVDQSKLIEAEKMYQRALNEKKKALNSKHISTLDIVNNLSNLYKNQNKLIEAKKMYQRALNEKKKE
ncbi:MAG: hypothetical protein Q9191_003843, partial [Dirinaria sp. TL-2023a]